MATTEPGRPRQMPPQLTLEHVSPATRLLEKRRQMFEVQEALDAQKEEYKRRETEFKRREEKLKEKDLQLQESLIKFNKFLQENDSKRARAEKKERDEQRQRVAKEAELENRRAELEQLRRQKADMQAVVAKDMRYQHYLESVIEDNDEYPEIQELLQRYNTLEVTHRDLVQRSREGQEETEAQAERNKRFLKEKMDEVLDSNNQIAELQQKYEAVVTQTHKLQADTDRRVQGAAEATLQLGQVLMACDNIYTRCMAKSNVTRKRLVDAEDDKAAALDKLNHIKEYLGDLVWITRNYRPQDGRAADQYWAPGMQADAGAAVGTGTAATGGVGACGSAVGACSSGGGGRSGLDPASGSCAPSASAAAAKAKAGRRSPKQRSSAAVSGSIGAGGGGSIDTPSGASARELGSACGSHQPSACNLEG